MIFNQPGLRRGVRLFGALFVAAALLSAGQYSITAKTYLDTVHYLAKPEM